MPGRVRVARQAVQAALEPDGRRGRAEGAEEELSAGSEAGSPIAKTCEGSGRGCWKPVPCTVASIVSPGRAARAQSLAHPSWRANSRLKVPAAGSGSTSVYARWCGLPALSNHSRAHIVGWTSQAVSSPPSVKRSRRYSGVTSSAPVTVRTKSFAPISFRTVPCQPCPCPMALLHISRTIPPRQT
ncbi:hypothetical protein GCM10020295_43250 [Streptomyces cinereospinus]